MIFVTVGAQMPFDRLVKAVDDWAASRCRSDVFAQIGPTDWCPRHIEWVHWLKPSEFRNRMATSTAIVAHAGMGSIITAQDLGKPILVMPRRCDLGETRTDHQFATARRFLGFGEVLVAFDDRDLASKLDHLGGCPSNQSALDYPCWHYLKGCPRKDSRVCLQYRIHGMCPNLLMILRRLIDRS